MLYRGDDGQLTGVSPRGYGILTQQALRATGVKSLCVVQRSSYTSLDRSCNKMAEKKCMLVKLGDSNRPVSFVSDGENQDIVRKIRKVYHDEISEKS